MNNNKWPEVILNSNWLNVSTDAYDLIVPSWYEISDIFAEQKTDYNKFIKFLKNQSYQQTKYNNLDWGNAKSCKDFEDFLQQIPYKKLVEYEFNPTELNKINIELLDRKVLQTIKRQCQYPIIDAAYLFVSVCKAGFGDEISERTLFIGRILTSYILVKTGFLPLTIEEGEKLAYISALKNAQNSNFQNIVDLICID